MSVVTIKEITAFCNILTDSDVIFMSVFSPVDTYIQEYGKVLFILSILLIFSVLFQELSNGTCQKGLAEVIQPLDSASELLDPEGLQAKVVSQADGTLSLLEELRAAATLAAENREDDCRRGRGAKNYKTVFASSTPDQEIALGNCPICLTYLFLRRWNSNTYGDSFHRDEVASYLDGDENRNDDAGSILLFDSSFSTVRYSRKDAIRSRRTPSSRRIFRNSMEIPDIVPPIFLAIQSEQGAVELMEISRNGQSPNSDPKSSSKISSFETTNPATPRANPTLLETTVVEAPWEHIFHKSC